ncbi:hypothetical protein AGLY_002916 [Aphis glycines]|uniref:Mos1 transposase HTH domain-containing protein n=1 Tax=Aphis glycines TaxID=307491 RepID=A0A6G0U1N3_APHGL|nr:hypothetical protein AGLY_002916 [Aphis glycines]
MTIESTAKCEIRAVIRYFVAKEKSPHEIFNEVRTVYGEGHMNRTSVYKWCREFKNGRTNVHDDLRSGRPSILTDDIVKKVENAVRDDRRLTLDELSAMFPQLSSSGSDNSIPSPTFDEIFKAHVFYLLLKYNKIVITLLDTTCSAFVDQHSQNNSTFFSFNKNSLDNTFFSINGFMLVQVRKTKTIDWVQNLVSSYQPNEQTSCHRHCSITLIPKRN